MSSKLSLPSIDIILTIIFSGYLQDFLIHVNNTEGVWELCYNYTDLFMLGETKHIYCYHPIYGDSVKITKPGLFQRLQLCEVQIFTVPNHGKFYEICLTFTNSPR